MHTFICECRFSYEYMHSKWARRCAHCNEVDFKPRTTWDRQYRIVLVTLIAEGFCFSLCICECLGGNIHWTIGGFDGFFLKKEYVKQCRLLWRQMHCKKVFLFKKLSFSSLLMEDGRLYYGPWGIHGKTYTNNKHLKPLLDV